MNRKANVQLGGTEDQRLARRKKKKKNRGAENGKPPRGRGKRSVFKKRNRPTTTIL